MIKENVLKIRERVSSACLRSNREPGQVVIVAVSKTRTVEQIEEAVASGITDIGENKVQEALLKYKNFSAVASGANRIKWHMVGHLQTNKAREAVGVFGLIHSVDSLRLAMAIDKEAARIKKVQDILVEVNTSGEAAKFGIRPDDAFGVVKEIARLKNIKIEGLMTIAPIVNKPEEARPYFRMLRELRDKIRQSAEAGCQLPVLSMGMTDDFEAAIEEGSNMVRIGRAIFGG